MALAEQFELLELIQRDTTETWLAVEKSTTRRLLLHRFREDTGLRQRLLSMGPEDLIMLVGAEREGASYVVVTHDLPPLRAFSRWVQERSDAVSMAKDEAFDPDRTQLMAGPAAGTKLAPPRVVDSEPDFRSSEPGEFTRLFAPSQTNPAKQSPALPVKPEPGEFTRMFEAYPAASERTESAASNRIPPAAPPPKTEPGEFTKLFYAPPKPAGESGEPTFPPPGKPKAKSDTTGEFTRMFQSSFATPAEPGKTLFPDVAAPPAPNPAKISEGDFTRMFNTLSPSAEGEVPKLDGGRVTGIFEKPQSTRTPAQLTQPMPAGPGEYTRIFQAAAPPADPAAASAAESQKPKDEQKPPAAVAATSSGNQLLLVVVLAVLLLAALALLLYFFLKR